MLGLNVALAIIIASGHSASPNGNGGQVVIMPVGWVTAVNSALVDFKKTHPNWECFDVVIIPQSDFLHVGFSSKPTTTEEPGTGIISIGPQTKCGTGAAYLVREDGKILERLRSE